MCQFIPNVVENREIECRMLKFSGAKRVKLKMTERYSHACTHDRIQKPGAGGFY